MKTNQRIIIILMFMMMAGLSDIYAQNKREIKEQREQAIKEQIIAEKYKISVNTAYPRRGRTVHLSSPYSVEIRNDSVISYLPFYGRAYSIPYGGGEGLIFQAPLDEYEMEMNKKGTAKVKFTARSPEDKFTFNLTIYSQRFGKYQCQYAKQRIYKLFGRNGVNNVPIYQCANVPIGCAIFYWYIGILINWYIDHIGILAHYYFIGTLFLLSFQYRKANLIFHSQNAGNEHTASAYNLCDHRIYS